jgi:pSer/pThr/pTyr-binding forkhead associated (FHA) protein
MPPFVLTVLKVLFLALLYFFVYRALHSVVVGWRGGSGRPVPATARPAARVPRKPSVKAPRSVAVVDERGSKVKTLQLNGTLQIGRADACQIKLPDTYVSSFHARIYRQDGGWYVEDLGSTNGTYLNQKRVTSPAELRAGDRVKVGKTTLELRR